MKLSYILFLCLAFVAVALGDWDDDNADTYETEKKILDTLLYRDDYIYDPKVPPGKRVDSPVEVTATMFILDITSVNDQKHEFSAQFYFRQKWRDPRLAFDHLETNLKHLRVLNDQRVWKPDSFFVHEREGKLHTIMMPNSFMRIYRNGDILYSVRLSMTFGCNMDLRYYPLDTQKCSFSIESYGSMANEIRYRWDNHSNSVMLNEEIDMPDFAVTDLKYSSDVLQYKTGRYSRLELDLKFKRKTGLFMNKLYVPFIILVIASWLSLWINPHFTSLRLTLILTILFIMFWLEADINRHVPLVSYTKAADVWTGVCLSLVFATLLQFILVAQLVKNEKHRKKQQKAAAGQDSLFVQEINDEKLQKNSSLDQPDVKVFSKLIAGNLCENKRLYNKIDIFSRVFYPVVFGLFNLIYWPVYCSGN